MDDRDVYGPVDTLVIEYPMDAAGVASAQALRDLLDRGTVLLYDLMVVSTDADGACVEVDLAATADGRLGALREFAGARSGLLGDDDLPALAEVLGPDTVGIVVVYENVWAVPFVAAARSEGAEVVASLRLGAQQIMDALEAVEASV